MKYLMIIFLTAAILFLMTSCNKSITYSAKDRDTNEVMASGCLGYKYTTEGPFGANMFDCQGQDLYFDNVLVYKNTGLAPVKL